MNDDRFEKGPDLRLGRTNLGDQAVISHCLDIIRDEGIGPDDCAVEFGVGHAHTLRMIAAVLPVIGFDSFMGLPEDWRPTHMRGHFGDAAVPANVTGATIVPGWFEHTVPDYDWPTGIRLVHLDADLYSSTIQALYSIGPALHSKNRPVLVFDEFFGYDDDFNGNMPGEQQAFWEWADEFDITFDVIGHGREQWAIRLR